MSFFDSVALLPEDPVFKLPALFHKDHRLHKVDLGIGSYEDAEGKPFVLTTVQQVERELAEKNLDKAYLPIAGDPNFIAESLKLVFGDTSSVLQQKRVFGAQTVGGTSALRIGADLLAELNVPCVYVSNPSWPNHSPLLMRAGLKVAEYPYYDPKTHALDFAALKNALAQMTAGSAVLLQVSCHNPTGVDFSTAQWKELSALLRNHRLLPFFDFAYQGFGKGLQEDAKPIRLFAEEGHEFLVATSHSKNFGLYGERLGCFGIVSADVEISQKVGTHIQKIIRTSYSNPPLHPARIVAAILQDPGLKKAWGHEVTAMRERVSAMREALAFGLMAKGTQHDFHFLLQQQGLFSYSGLTSEQVLRLRKEKGLYLLENGRINVASINSHNLDYVIDSILAVL